MNVNVLNDQEAFELTSVVDQSSIYSSILIDFWH